MTSQLSVVQVQGSEQHLSALARLHARSFPDSALTKLGHNALMRYYAWQLSDVHDSIALIAQYESRPVGFCVGGTFRGALSGFVRHNIRFLIMRIIIRPSMLLHGAVWRRIPLAGLSLWRGMRDPPVRPRPTEQRFGIQAIGVDPSARRLGAGRALMDAAESIARSRGAAVMTLSVGRDNASAIRFYSALGWQMSSVAVTHGAVSMVKSIDAAALGA